MITLDTSFLVAVDEREPRAMALEERFRADGEDYLVPAPAWVEYLTGFSARSSEAKARFLDKVAIFVPLDRATANEAVRIQRSLLKKGRPLSWSDLYIAATAIEHDTPLVTMDKDFELVPRLEVLRP